MVRKRKRQSGREKRPDTRGPDRSPGRHVRRAAATSKSQKHGCWLLNEVAAEMLVLRFKFESSKFNCAESGCRSLFVTSSVFFCQVTSALAHSRCAVGMFSRFLFLSFFLSFFFCLLPLLQPSHRAPPSLPTDAPSLPTDTAATHQAPLRTAWQP
jgi:hypothetical protein